MATHDYIISNASGAAVRADLNNALAAIVSNNSNATSPATTYAFQFWADTTTGQLKIRNAANSAWITLMELDGTMLMEDGSASSPGLAFADDTDTGIFSAQANSFNIATGGVERIAIGDSEIIFNNPSNDVDFRVESNGNANMLFVDGGNDRVGVGTNSPAVLLDVADSSGNEPKLRMSTGTATNFFQISRSSSTGHYTLASEENGSSIILATDPDSTGAVDRLTVDRNGNVGIGTTSVATDFHIHSSSGSDNTEILLTNGDTGATATDGFKIALNSGEGGEIWNYENDYIRFGTNNTEVARLDSDGRLLVGLTSARATKATASIPSFQIEGTGDSDSRMNIGRNSNGDNGPEIHLYKTRGTSLGSNTVVQDDDFLGTIGFYGADGSDLFSRGAEITAAVDGTPGNNDMPTRLTFSTCADGSSSATERMRITSSGLIGINETNPGHFLDMNIGSTNTGIKMTSTDAGAFIQFADNGTTGETRVGANSNDLVFETATSEAARIDSSQRFLLGTSSVRQNFYNGGGTPTRFQLEGTSFSTSAMAIVRNSDNASDAEIIIGKSRSGSVGGYGVVQSGDHLGAISFQGADGSELVEAASILAVVEGAPGANDMPGSLRFSVTQDGNSAPTERFRIGSYGRSHSFSSDGATLILANANGGSTSDYLIIGRHSSTLVDNGTNALFVYTNGNIQNTNNSYGQISDVKLKENIVNANSQWDDIKDIQVRNFNFKQETGNPTHTQIGVVAQELETVSPGLVYETPDRDAEGNDLGTVTKSVNYSVLYMKAVKALQEAMDRIETLETKVAALEAG